jgi:hypothetical protein
MGVSGWVSKSQFGIARARIQGRVAAKDIDLQRNSLGHQGKGLDNEIDATDAAKERSLGKQPMHDLEGSALK